MKRYTLILCASLFISLQTVGQAIPEKVHAPQIKTVQMHKKGEPLSPPLITLNAGEQVTLRFDDLKGSTTSYSYQLIHCNATWEPSGIMPSTYLSGQHTGEIYHHESSFNTLISYTHYRLHIPNETMKPTRSGNYILHVYRNSNPSDTILTRRFRISENRMGVRAQVDRVNQMSREKPNQELNLTLHTRSLDIRDPYRNLTFAVQQNYHRERIITNLDPSSMHGNTLSYEMQEKLTFKGGNEFHHFNSKNTDFAAENIKTINFTRNNFHFQLKEDHDRTFQPYNMKKDINGRFQVDRERVDDPNLEADYVYVYFTLKGVSFDPEGHYYVAGDFNNWQYNEKNRLRYDGQSQTYQKRLFLKQGYYDYKYVYRSGNTTDPFRISGNHEQAENAYLICVYYRDHQKGYDRLVGHTLVNSSAKDF